MLGEKNKQTGKPPKTEVRPPLQMSICLSSEDRGPSQEPQQMWLKKKMLAGLGGQGGLTACDQLARWAHLPTWFFSGPCSAGSLSLSFPPR